MKIYKIEILRYGCEKLGQDLFGYFTSKETALKQAVLYNIHRGGKYPEVIIEEYALDKGVPFKEPLSVERVDLIKALHLVSDDEDWEKLQESLE